MRASATSWPAAASWWWPSVAAIAGSFVSTPLELPPDARAGVAAFSPDAKRLVTYGIDRQAYIWDVDALLERLRSSVAVNER